MNAILLQTYINAFLLIPPSLAFAKCVPHSVEGIMMGLLGSVTKFGGEILMRLMSLVFLINADVDIEHWENLGPRMFWASWYQVIAMFVIAMVTVVFAKNWRQDAGLIKFVVDRHEFDDFQRVL